MILMLKRNYYLNQIRPFVGKDVVKVLTGIRRCGKSVLLGQIRDEIVSAGTDESRIVVLNFEDEGNKGLRSADALEAFVVKRLGKKKTPFYLFLDEIQEVEGWQRCVNSLRVKPGVDIIITGSNARLLSGELSTYLSGRYVEIQVHPFSFAEYLEARGVAAGSPDVAAEFMRFVRLGGMPFLANLNWEESPSRQYLHDLFNSVVLRDILLRNKIRDADLMERLISYLSANIGRIFSATSISKYFKHENRKVAPETILNYIRYCEDAFLLRRIKRADLSGKKILEINDKFYFPDHGLREAAGGGNVRDIELVLENIVCMELVRRGYSLTVGALRDGEVDFVAEKGKARLYVQVAYLLASEETVRREFGALAKINDNHPKFVLSMDEFDRGDNGIRHLNIKDFLLGKEGRL